MHESRFLWTENYCRLTSRAFGSYVFRQGRKSAPLRIFEAATCVHTGKDHTKRWHAHYETGGTGHLYQRRFKSFPIQSDGHLLTVMSYVERNPVRANIIELAEDWQWSSAYARRLPIDERRLLTISDDPALPRNWRSWVNKVETEAELTTLRHSVRRGLPFGDDQWTKSSAVRLGFETTTPPRGGRELSSLYDPLHAEYRRFPKTAFCSRMSSFFTRTT